MGKGLVWSDQARADLSAIEKNTALQILKTIARFLKTGHGDTRQLTDIAPPLFRLRAQDHRVLYRDHGPHIVIARILNRKEAYR